MASGEKPALTPVDSELSRVELSFPRITLSVSRCCPSLQSGIRYLVPLVAMLKSGTTPHLLSRSQLQVIETPTGATGTPRQHPGRESRHRRGGGRWSTDRICRRHEARLASGTIHQLRRRDDGALWSKGAGCAHLHITAAFDTHRRAARDMHRERVRLSLA